MGYCESTELKRSIIGKHISPGAKSEAAKWLCHCPNYTQQKFFFKQTIWMEATNFLFLSSSYPSLAF